MEESEEFFYVNSKGVKYYFNQRFVTLYKGRVEMIYYATISRTEETIDTLPEGKKIIENKNCVPYFINADVDLDDNEIPKEIYLVELVYMSAEMYNVYEVSVSIGYADWDEEIEQWVNFERNDYVSERYFLSDSKKGFIFGNEIENIDWDEIDVSKLYINEYYEDEEEANKYAEKLIEELKNGKWNR